MTILIYIVITIYYRKILPKIADRVLAALLESCFLSCWFSLLLRRLWLLPV